MVPHWPNMSIQDSAGLIAERSCRPCNDCRSTDSRHTSHYFADAAAATDDNDDNIQDDLHHIFCACWYAHWVTWVDENPSSFTKFNNCNVHHRKGKFSMNEFGTAWILLHGAYQQYKCRPVCARGGKDWACNRLRHVRGHDTNWELLLQRQQTFATSR